MSPSPTQTNGGNMILLHMSANYDNSKEDSCKAKKKKKNFLPNRPETTLNLLCVDIFAFLEKKHNFK